MFLIIYWGIYCDTENDNLQTKSKMKFTAVTKAIPKKGLGGKWKRKCFEIPYWA